MTPIVSCPHASTTTIHDDLNINGQMVRVMFLALVFLLIRNTSSAQLYSEDAAIAQALFSKTKRVLISSYMEIDDTPANSAFWRLYDEYEANRKAISQERFYLLKEYSDRYRSLDDATAAKLAEGFMENTAKVDKLNRQYFKKFRKLVGGLQAATLFQIEVYAQTALQNDTNMQIPIIGELQKINEQAGISRF
ncbi:MAG TPA: hypothetical protein VF141_16385 [Chryseolinea sp.]